MTNNESSFKKLIDRFMWTLLGVCLIVFIGLLILSIPAFGIGIDTSKEWFSDAIYTSIITSAVIFCYFVMEGKIGV